MIRKKKRQSSSTSASNIFDPFKNNNPFGGRRMIVEDDDYGELDANSTSSKGRTANTGSQNQETCPCMGDSDGAVFENSPQEDTLSSPTKDDPDMLRAYQQKKDSLLRNVFTRHHACPEACQGGQKSRDLGEPESGMARNTSTGEGTSGKSHEEATRQSDNENKIRGANLVTPTFSAALKCLLNLSAGFKNNGVGGAKVNQAPKDLVDMQRFFTGSTASKTDQCKETSYTYKISGAKDGQRPRKYYVRREQCNRGDETGSGYIIHVKCETLAEGTEEQKTLDAKEQKCTKRRRGDIARMKCPETQEQKRSISLTRNPPLHETCRRSRSEEGMQKVSCQRESHNCNVPDSTIDQVACIFRKGQPPILLDYAQDRHQHHCKKAPARKGPALRLIDHLERKESLPAAQAGKEDSPAHKTDTGCDKRRASIPDKTYTYKQASKIKNEDEPCSPRHSIVSDASDKHDPFTVRTSLAQEMCFRKFMNRQDNVSRYACMKPHNHIGQEFTSDSDSPVTCIPNHKCKPAASGVNEDEYKHHHFPSRIPRPCSRTPARAKIRQARCKHFRNAEFHFQDIRNDVSRETPTSVDEKMSVDKACQYSPPRKYDQFTSDLHSTDDVFVSNCTNRNIFSSNSFLVQNKETNEISLKEKETESFKKILRRATKQYSEHLRGQVAELASSPDRPFQEPYSLGRLSQPCIGPAKVLPEGCGLDKTVHLTSSSPGIFASSSLQPNHSKSKQSRYSSPRTLSLCDINNVGAEVEGVTRRSCPSSQHDISNDENSQQEETASDASSLSQDLVSHPVALENENCSNRSRAGFQTRNGNNHAAQSTAQPAFGKSLRPTRRPTAKQTRRSSQSDGSENQNSNSYAERDFNTNKLQTVPMSQMLKIIEEAKMTTGVSQRAEDIKTDPYNPDIYEQNFPPGCPRENTFIGEYLVRLWRNQCLCDVEVTVGDDVQRVHKLVLAAFSSIFRPEMAQPPPTITFTIPCSSPEAVHQVFSYIYTCTMELSEALIAPILAAAVFMGISEVMDIMKSILSKPKPENIDKYMSILGSNNMAMSAVEMPKFYREHFTDIIHTDFFLAQSADEFEVMLMDPDVMVKDERDTIEAIAMWTRYNFLERCNYLERLLRLVSFECINPKTLAEVAEKHNYIFNTPAGHEFISEAFKFHAMSAADYFQPCIKGECVVPDVETEETTSKLRDLYDKQAARVSKVYGTGKVEIIDEEPLDLHPFKSTKLSFIGGEIAQPSGIAQPVWEVDQQLVPAQEMKPPQEEPRKSGSKYQRRC